MRVSIAGVSEELSLLTLVVPIGKDGRAFAVPGHKSCHLGLGHLDT